MRYLKLTLAYDGSQYAGWQVQPNGVAIQQLMETAWRSVTGETTRIVAAGRTDAGVHALGQVCSLATRSTLPSAVLVSALNAHLPNDVAVLRVEEAADGFHAVRHAIGKHYCYWIYNHRIRPVIGRQSMWHVRRSLDIEAMKQGAEYLKGRHDFASFQSRGAPRRSTVRTITRLDISWLALDGGDGRSTLGRHPNWPPSSGEGTPADFPRRFAIDIEADGFLYHMVRSIVGTLVQVGLGRRPPPWVQQVRHARNRNAAGMTAPPHGLFLVNVFYGAGLEASRQSPNSTDLRYPGED